MDKRLWIIIFFCFFCGCQKKNTRLSEWIENDDKLRILSTTAMIENLVSEIGAERVNSLALIQGGLDPHSYELVKGDDEKLSQADLIFYNGLGLEHGASLSSYLKNSSCSVSIGDEMQKKYPEKILVIDRVVDPHVWMSVSLWISAIDFVVDALVEKDPDFSSYYNSNADHLREEMLRVHRKIKKTMKSIPEKSRYLVTSHDAFRYFALEYLAEKAEKDSSQWKRRIASPEGLAPEMQLSLLDIQKIIDHLVEYGVEVIFAESNVSSDSLRKIVSAANEKGLNVRIATERLYSDAIMSSENTKMAYLETQLYNA